MGPQAKFGGQGACDRVATHVEVGGDMGPQAKFGGQGACDRVSEDVKVVFEVGPLSNLGGNAATDGGGLRQLEMAAELGPVSCGRWMVGHGRVGIRGRVHVQCRKQGEGR